MTLAIFNISSQFHQRFTSAYLVQNFGGKNFKPKTQLCNFWHQNFIQKRARKTLMKLTPTWIFSRKKKSFSCDSGVQ